MNTKDITNKFRKTPKGLLTNMYDRQRRRNKQKGFGEMGYSLQWFHDRFLNDTKFLRLFKEWEKSGYAKPLIPSIDRIDNKKGYEKNNIHLLTWGENRFKETMERRSRKGKVYQKLNGKIIKIWGSQREIWRSLNLTQSMLSQALTGKCKTAYGYEWEYVGNIHENKELLK